MTDIVCADDRSAIGDPEMIVRAALFPFHFNKKLSKPAKSAFHPGPGATSVSAIRAADLSADRCKEIGKNHVQDLTTNPQRKYCGLWTLQAACIRLSGAEVAETTGDYDRHVSIEYGVARPRNDALATPDDVIRYNEIIDGLMNHAKLFLDKDVETAAWNGGVLHVRSCIPGELAVFDGNDVCVATAQDLADAERAS